MYLDFFPFLNVNTGKVKVRYLAHHIVPSGGADRTSTPGGAWLAQLVQRATLDLRVTSSNSTLGIEVT